MSHYFSELVSPPWVPGQLSYKAVAVRRQVPPRTSLMSRYAFVYFMNDNQEQIRETVRRHVEYWERLALPDYSGGPFEDRSGGLITFSAASMADAERLISKDPFIVADVLAEQLLKPWLVK